MSSTAVTPKRPIQLHYRGGDVVVTPEDHDRFVMATQHAIWACQHAVAAKRLWDDFKSHVLAPLRTWCEAQRQYVRGCYIPLGSSGDSVKVFVVSKAPRFDFLLSDLVADLEIRLAKDEWPCDILQIAADTPDEIQAFFDPAQSVEVFSDANTGAASGEG